MRQQGWGAAFRHYEASRHLSSVGCIGDHAGLAQRAVVERVEMVAEQQRAILPRFLVAWGTAGRAAAAVVTAVAPWRRERPARAAAAAAVVAAAAPWLREGEWLRLRLRRTDDRWRLSSLPQSGARRCSRRIVLQQHLKVVTRNIDAIYCNNDAPATLSML